VNFRSIHQHAFARVAACTGHTAIAEPHTNAETVLRVFHILRHGLRLSKIGFLAWHAWRDEDTGAWPRMFPETERTAYDLPEIWHWLDTFCRRFFGFAQFKRSTLPNGPKVLAGGSLSPRGDWRAPSDSTAQAWLRDLARWEREIEAAFGPGHEPAHAGGAGPDDPDPGRGETQAEGDVLRGGAVVQTRRGAGEEGGVGRTGPACP
jgi:hypothetical protein